MTYLEGQGGLQVDTNQASKSVNPGLNSVMALLVASLTAHLTHAKGPYLEPMNLDSAVGLMTNATLSAQVYLRIIWDN